MTTDYGQDLNFDGLDLAEVGGLVSGVTLLSQAIQIRLSTGRSVIDSPDDGIDITEELSRGYSPAQVAALSGRIEREILKDERFLAVKATVNASRLVSTGEILIDLKVDAGEGPFSLVLSATAAGVEILGGQ